MVDKSVYGSNSDSERGFFNENSNRTPDYWNLVDSGAQLPQNNYYFYRYDAQHPVVNTYNGPRNEIDARGYLSIKTAVNSGIFVGQGAQDFVPVKVDSRDLAHRLVQNKLIQKARNIEIDLGVALGEYRETAEFIASAMRKTAGMMRALKRGNLSEALTILRSHNKSSNLRGVSNINPRKSRQSGDIRRVLDAASETQLSTSFALTPLINDVSDAVTILENQLKNGTGKNHTVRASVEGEHSFSDDWTNGYTSRSFTCDFSYRASGKINYGVGNPVFATLESVGFTNPLSIGWELVPFSFVVDWFVPVGAFIENVFPPSGLDFIDGYTYYKCNGSATQRTDRTGWHTQGSFEEEMKDRKKLSDFPRYSFIVPDLSLSKKQIRDGMALLWSSLS